MSSEGAASSQSSSYKIKLPAKYFEFVHDQMGGKGFKVKCLLCHENPHNTSQSGGCPKDVNFGHWSYPLDVSWRS